MTKVKYIIQKTISFLQNRCKKSFDIHTLSRLVWCIAIVLMTIAMGLVFFYKPVHDAVFSTEVHNVIAVQSGDTLSKLLGDEGFSAQDVDTIYRTLKKEVGFSTLHADRDKIDFVRPSENEPISKIVIIDGPWNRVEIDCGQPGEWQCQKIEIERDTRVALQQGEILDGDSFYLAGQRGGIPAGILARVYDLLAFEIDFERDVRAGQKFYVLYEENYASGKKVDNGNVLAVSYEALRGNVQMYYFVKADGKDGYYDENGNGAIKSLKRTPINNAKVTSSFSGKRKHPVLGYTRAHKGVDFRAPTGTPIPAAGSGRVVARGYNNGHGNYVKIRHNASFETLYAHMSRFAKNVKVGTFVKQGQIIGYSGSTGISTGPHLHYEVIKNGQHVNPMTVKLPAINNLDDKNKTVFKEYKARVDSVIKSLQENPKQIIRLTQDVQSNEK